MQASINDEESSLLLSSNVQTIERKPVAMKALAAATASALLLGFAYMSSQQPSMTAMNSTTDLASAMYNEYDRYTDKNSDGRLIYLDRHNMDQCGTNPMAGFKLVDRLRFRYKCRSITAPTVGNADTRTTNPSWGYDGIQFLDRHSAFCPSDRLMSTLKGNTRGSDFYWSFSCQKYDVKSLKCDTQYTGYNEFGPGDTMVFLDRHDVYCGDNRALQGFAGETADLNCRNECTWRVWGNCWSSKRVCDPRFRFRYSCCSAELKDPTAAPTQRPTDFPIASPTKKPIATPTQSPTDFPVAKPTEEPVAAPTMEPIAEPTMAPNRDKEIAAEKKALALAKIAADEAEAALNKLMQEQAELERIQNEQIAAAAKAAEEAANAAAEKKAAEEALAVAKAEADKAAAEEAAKKVKEALALEEEAQEAVKKANEEKAAAAKKETEVQQQIAAQESKLSGSHTTQVTIGKIKEERASTLACPFTFKQGVSKVKVPAGCVFLATNDVTFSSQKRTSSPAVYFCTKASTPLQLDEKDLQKYGLQSSVSYIQPGKETGAVFYSGQSFKGQSAMFTSTSYKPLNSFKFKDGSSANDKVKSLAVSSTTDDIPESCEELTFSSNMKMNTKLIEKDGKFFSS